MATDRLVTSWARTARDLYLVAMAVFVVTIVIGILNGSDAVEFDRNAILTHVHSGTIGWLSLTIIASTFLLFQAADRRLMLALAALVPLYVAAFYTGNLLFRAASGLALLATILWLLAWVWRQYLGGERSLPRLALVLALTTFGYGAVIGVLLQVQFALGLRILTGDSVGAHAGAMTFGYLVLAAFGFLEWRVLGTRDLPKAGVVQVVLLFVGGLIISVGLLAGQGQAAGGLYLLVELVTVTLFIVRVLPRALRINWGEAGPVRHLSVASIWVVVALGLFMYVVAMFVQNPNDFEALPINVLVASDHAVFIGVVTNIVVALLLGLLTAGATGRAWVGQLTFWGINLGLAVFVFGLIVDTAEIKRIGAPVMGIALLATLAILAWQALAASEGGLEEGGPAPSEPAVAS